MWRIQYIYHWVLRSLGSLPRTCRFMWQGLRWGFSDKETWNLDCTIAKFVLPRLKRFKELNNGVPCLEEFKDLDIEEQEKEWNKILDKMIYSLSFIVNEDYWSITPEEDRIQEGLELFGKHFRRLWW